MMHTYFRFQGNFRCLKLLLNKGANWKEKDNEGQTAMHLSTRHKSNKCLALLMKQLEMAEIDDQDKNKVHVQLKTSWYRLLLNRLCLFHRYLQCLSKAAISQRDVHMFQRTCLHWAASYGNLDHIKMLTKADSNIGIPDIDGKTPLHWAASSKDNQAVDCVQLILVSYLLVDVGCLSTFSSRIML